MEITEAIREAVARLNWSTEKVAVETSSSYGTVKKWLNGQAIPGGESLMKLRRGLPGFAELLDGERVA
jgi:transcriptional regulator with XRE-family HTH domain